MRAALTRCTRSPRTSASKCSGSLAGRISSSTTAGPFDPAAVERNAVAAVRLADTFLRSSFRSTDRSRQCRQIAGRATRAAKLGRARIAETEAQMATARACERDSSWYAETERWDRCPLCGEPWSWHRDASEPQS